METETRTDVHSPKNIIMEDYEFVACFDTGLIGYLSSSYDIEIAQKVSETNIDRGMGQCHHCGSRMRYTAVVEHVPTGDYIAIGETCLDNRFSLATNEFQKMRKAAALEAGKHKIKKAIDAFVIAHPALSFLDARRNEQAPVASEDNNFLQSLGHQLNRNGSLTERQIDAAHATLAKDAERAAQKAARDTAEASKPAAGPVPTGRVVVRGVVVGLKHTETQWGDTYKMMVELGNGSKVYVSVPAAIDPEREDCVEFTCTITASDGDSTFGFGKRPSKATVLS